MHNIYLETELY